MKIKQIAYLIGFLILSVIAVSATAAPSYAEGACADGTNAYEGSASMPTSTYSDVYGHSYGFCTDGTSPTEASTTYSQNVFNTTGDKTCGGVGTSIISCDQGDSKDLENNGIYGILLLVINILTGMIGVVTIGGVVYASILYASAGGGSEQIKKAKTMLVNIGIGVIAYLLMYSLLNFIIPGGLFN